MRSIILNIGLIEKYIRSFRLSFSFLLVLVIFLLPVIAQSQITKILGKVVDKETNEPIPFANIIILNSLQGTLTDFEGKYSLEIKGVKPDSIRASLLGYSQSTKPISVGIFQTINFELSSKDQELPEVVIKYKGNPADALIDSIVKYKQKNTVQSFETSQYDVYTKIRLEANNVSERVAGRKFMKPFQFVLTYVDTSTINGKSYLPVMMSETNSVIYERKSPKSKKEMIKASRVSGIDNTNVSQFLGSMSQEIDVYQNLTEIFEKNFVSPIADFSHIYYKYYLIDSSFINKKWCYHIMFKPKRKQELTYTGGLWVNDTSYALIQINLRIAADANINFINDLGVEQQFEWTNDQIWMKSKERLWADFNPFENAKKIIGLYGHKTTFYNNYIFDSLDYDDVFKEPTYVIIHEDAVQNSDAYWDTIRPESLSGTEEGIYEMVDSVKNVPRFQHIYDLLYGLGGGYFPWGKVEVGPYFKFFSYNKVEGARFRFGGRTSTKLSKKFQIGAYLAYGTYDEQFKYGADFLYLFNKSPRRSLFVSFKYDLEQLGSSPDGRSTDNILSSFYSRGPIDKLTLVREYKAYYEHEWFNGLINKFVVQRREIFPLGNTKFIVYPESIEDTVYLNSITTSEIGLDTRISFNEKYISGKYSRISIKSQYPLITIRYRYGFPNLFNTDFSYHKLNIGVNQWFNLGTIGWSRFNLDIGKIWGTLPYPLLKIHDANETWLFTESASNLMDYYEFVSDQYIDLFYTHHFDGLLFNRIPLIRKLKWREVIYFRGVYGTLTDANRNFSAYPDNLRPLGNEPYIETGAAIENIFKVIRIDAIWRLTHLNDPENQGVSKFGIFASLYFAF